MRLVLSSPASGQGVPKKVSGRCVELKGVPYLSVTFLHATRAVTRNIAVAESAAWLRQQLGGAYRCALLCTTRRDWQFIAADGGPARLIGHKPSTTLAPSRTHDRERAMVLDATALDWLHELGLTDSSGKVRASMADKYRQINRYLEILMHLARDCGWDKPYDAADGGLVFADMGCGKGYLTFGAWHLFRRLLQRPVRVVGVEARADLVAAANALAEKVGAEGLEFVCGTIATVALPRLDALIALHACDTATDDAILRGIELGAKLIVLAPCCQKQLRPQLGRPEPLAPLLRHGIMAGRMADWLTDGLRALFLEWAGYRAKVFEFVASAHTPKNLMIAAIRKSAPFADAAVKRQILELKAFFGIQHHALDGLLEQSHGSGGD